jgi:hypothetical protein
MKALPFVLIGIFMIGMSVGGLLDRVIRTQTPLIQVDVFLDPCDPTNVVWRVVF